MTSERVAVDAIGPAATHRSPLSVVPDRDGANAARSTYRQLGGMPGRPMNASACLLRSGPRGALLAARHLRRGAAPSGQKDMAVNDDHRAPPSVVT